MSHDPIVTCDLSRFGYRELQEAAKLLTAYCEEASTAFFLGDNVQLCFNTNSGYVFLTDEDYNVGMLNDEGKISQWHSCPICSFEGFLEDMQHNPDDKECQEYLTQIGVVIDDKKVSE